MRVRSASMPRDRDQNTGEWCTKAVARAGDRDRPGLDLRRDESPAQNRELAGREMLVMLESGRTGWGGLMV